MAGTTLDIFTREQMVKAYEKSVGNPLFLFSTIWGSPAGEKVVTADEKIAMDKINKTRYMAGYTHHQEPARIIQKEGYDTVEFAPPFINESVPFNYAHASKRPAGVTPFGTSSVKTGADELLRNARELKNRWLRTVEYQCAQALVNGQFTILGKTYDFGMKSAHKKTLSTKWNTADADPYADLDTYIALNETDSGTPTDTVIMNIEAWQAFRNNEKVLAGLDKRWISVGDLNEPSYNKAMNASLKGALELTESTVKIWVYGGRYYDVEAEETKRYFPSGKVWVGSANTRFDQYYTGFFDAEYMDMVEAEYMIDQFIQKNPDVVMTRLRSCPLMAPVDIDSYSILTVI
ncbi:MAG: major capsid protein [Spirochaetia bacterium]|nr:major capsid protein [Spirochaetia bacterium]